MDNVTVRYVGPVYAVLAGKAIRTGEVRTVSRQQLDEARRYHPEGFQVLGGEVKQRTAIQPIDAVSVPAAAVEDLELPKPEPVKAVVKRGSVKKKKS